MTKPKPKPAKPATPEVSSPSGDQPQGSENFDSASSENTPGTEVPLASEEPMETEKPETAT